MSRRQANCTQVTSPVATLPAVSSSRWSQVVLLVLLGHLVWGLARVPSRGIDRRACDIARYRRLGDATFLLGQAALQGAEAIVWLRAHTAEGQRVPWQGADRGPIEFAAALLWPRLLVADDGGGQAPTLVSTPTSLTIRER